MPTSLDHLPIADALQALREQYGVACRYPRFWLAIQAGEIPAVRGTDGRSWFINRADLPRIAELLRQPRSPRAAA